MTKETIKKTKKKIDVEKEEKNIEVEETVPKKKKKKKRKEQEQKTVMKFLNKPLPIIIALVALCIIQLFFLMNINSKNAIYNGELNKNDVQIVNVHIFTNNDMNYFYAAPAAYLGDDKKIYNFEMGYYIKMEDDKYLPFATRARELENASSLKEIVEEMSGWNFFETSIQDYYFSDEVLNNLDKVYFMIKASTKSGSTDADVLIQYPIDLNKITK